MATRLRDAGGTLLELDAELRRLTRRADRQQRRMRQSADAWQLWSSTIDDGLDIVGRIDDALPSMSTRSRSSFGPSAGAFASTRTLSWMKVFGARCVGSGTSWHV